MAKQLDNERVKLEVEISKIDYERLTRKATERGFITISEYVRHLLRVS
jgi:hypothetical protein